jgi:RNA recognition motif. (a.k.a. RRM, RBD, or RNP domain)
MKQFDESYSWTTPTASLARPSSTLSLYITDADLYDFSSVAERQVQLILQENAAGPPKKYEMLPLPDSMLETTVFCGNLCEFVQDDDLSRLFRAVSQSVPPACVIRKVNLSSLRYGFVAFCTADEAQRAILQFNGYNFRNHLLKVESIQEFHPRTGQRVKVPARFIQYCTGSIKPIHSSSNNSINNKGRLTSLRHASVASVPVATAKMKPKDSKTKKLVDWSRLSAANQCEVQRARARGYLTLGPGGGTSGSLCKMHQQHCTNRGQPQILWRKAQHGTQRPLDQVSIDFCPLSAVWTKDQKRAAISQIFAAAQEMAMRVAPTPTTLRLDSRADGGMHDAGIAKLCRDNELAMSEEHCVSRSGGKIVPSRAIQQPTEALPIALDGAEGTQCNQFVQAALSQQQLYFAFVGERHAAKAMVKTLAATWQTFEEIPEGSEAERLAKRDGVLPVRSRQTPKISTVLNRSVAPSRTKSNVRDCDEFDQDNNDLVEDGDRKRRRQRKEYRNNSLPSAVQQYRRRGGGHRQAW